MHRHVGIPVVMTRRKRADGIRCSEVINEDCATCEHAHMKNRPFKRVEGESCLWYKGSAEAVGTGSLEWVW
jgi:hypothetical protein